MSTKRILVGVDGFIDHVSLAVAHRRNADEYERFEQLPSFAEKIAHATGRSCNIELAPVTTTIGGNAPLMTLALNRQNCRTTLLGCLGAPDPMEIFAPLVRDCERVISLADPGVTHAIEFDDGKVLLGQLESLHHLNFESLIQRITWDGLVGLFQESDLIALVNWTMLLGMTSIWQGIYDQICPLLTDRPRTLFVDLADPAKRSSRELEAALQLLTQLQEYFSVILGLNVSEAEQVSRLLGESDSGASALELATRIRHHLPLHTVLVHHSRAAAVSSSSLQIELGTPFVTSPARTTGAGDHFNAGYCRAWLETEDPEQALRAAIATASYYVKTGISPEISNLSLE